jgi:hypothetical protein
MTDHDNPVERFLAQPPVPPDAPDPEPPASGPVPRRGLWGWITHFLFEKEASPYSSLAPRSPDG